jgi:hypothetical protein
MNPLDEQLNRLLSGAVEFHVHFSPDGLSQRSSDAFELLRDAKSAGMRAVVLKNKSIGTGAIAQLANTYSGGALAIGAITLDTSIGGFNPQAVAIEAALGSKVVWMPTFSAKNDPSHKKTEKEILRNNLSIFNSNGELLPEVIEIISLIKDHGMVLATGHISREETFALIETASAMGVKKLVIDHPLMEQVGTYLAIEDQIALSKMGAYIEHCWCAAMPKYGHVTPGEFAESIRAVGVEKCILATDFGQIIHPAPLEGFRIMLGALLQEGFSIEELELMVKVNPSELLGLPVRTFD